MAEILRQIRLPKYSLLLIIQPSEQSRSDNYMPELMVIDVYEIIKLKWANILFGYYSNVILSEMHLL